MRIDLTGRRGVMLAATRTGLFSVPLLLALGLSACTTTEGTNALSDATTFEREVMTSTLQGLGVIDKAEKPEPTSPRAPLVLPKSSETLPAPTTADDSLLPKDSAIVQIDMTGLTEADLKRLRNARVVDLTSLSGRPLTEEEARQLTARMSAARLKAGKRSIYLPPEEYYTTVNGKDLVCLAANGELVTLDDPACPPEIRAALAKT